MKEFLTLFKYELKMQMPFFKRRGKDVFSNVLMLLIVAFMAYAGVMFVSNLLKNYVLVEIDKVYSPLNRVSEMLNVLYVVILAIVTITFLESTRKAFTDDKNKMIFLRLPLKTRNIFLSKFCVLLLRIYAISFLLIISVNSVVASVIAVNYKFWLSTFGICLFLPLVSLFLVCLMIVPYIKLLDTISNKYFILFVVFTVLLVGAFILYSIILGVVQRLLTTGSIRFLFNKDFALTLQSLYKYCYPANLFTAVLFKQSVAPYWLLIIGFSIMAILVACLISKKLYFITLYKQQKKNFKTRKLDVVKKHRPIVALILKESKMVFRQPKYLFSYVSIAFSMPIMAYCCYTLFETLIFNALGMRINFALALSVIMIFGILTNTFCATNVTRDGLGVLKNKTLPLNASKLFSAKIIFCGIISSMAVLITCLLLVFATRLKALDGLMCFIIGLTFTFAQILVATRLDLNQAKISQSNFEVEKQSSKTLIKVTFIGIVLIAICSLSTICFALLSSGVKWYNNITIFKVGTYLAPVLIGIIYLVIAIVFYRRKILKSFEKLAS